jgi:hypothetical protein
MNTLRMLDRHAERLREILFDRPGVEAAAYLRCAVVRQRSDLTLLVRDVVPVMEDHYLLRGSDRLSIASDSYVPVLKQARVLGEAFVFIHTHPAGPRHYSTADDQEERRLFETVRARVAARPHASIIFVDMDTFVGRLYDENGMVQPLDRIVVVGARMRLLLGDTDVAPLPVFLDRQVRAFGEDVQRVLRHIRVGIVGGGGTGSPTFEQCLRLGVGEILCIDPQLLDETNVNRVWNSRRTDAGTAKIEIMERTAQRSGLPTIVRTIQGSINDPQIARELVSVDVVFGCTDKELPRAILCRLATRYLIPVIDMGVVVRSTEGRLTGVTGRVTTVYPGTSCLMCRGRLSPATIHAESLSPEEHRRLVAEGYAPELDTPDPAVITFTTAVAAFAVNEFLHRLTGFMGDRKSTETLIQFDVPQIRSNATPAEPWCDCATQALWGIGNEEPFLGIAWRDATGT